MAIIGILAGITAGAVTGLGGQGINAQILSDASAMETAADRFLNASFPETFPVSALPSGEDELGVREIDFDAKLPQDPTKTFVPDFLKKIPDSAALVSFRIDTGTGRIFTRTTEPRSPHLQTADLTPHSAARFPWAIRLSPSL